MMLSGHLCRKSHDCTESTEGHQQPPCLPIDFLTAREEYPIFLPSVHMILQFLVGSE